MANWRTVKNKKGEVVKIILDKNATEEEKEYAKMNAQTFNVSIVPKKSGKKGEKLTYNDMRKALASDKQALDELDKYISQKINYFKIKAWYKAMLKKNATTSK